METQFLPELASGGLFIRSDKFLPLGSEVDIDLYLPSATEPLPLRGRVTRVVDDDDARARKATGMTLAVDTNSEPTRSRLDALYAAYRIPVKKPAHDADVTPGHPVKSHGSNGANGAMGMVVPLPGPSSRPTPPADDDLPSPRGAIPPELPAPPSIPPAVPPVPVMKFSKRTSSNEAIPLPGGPMSPAPEASSDKPLPFPFSRAAAEPAAPPKIPAFGDLSAAELAPPPPPPMEVVELPPPPPPAAAMRSGSDDARLKQLEQSEEKAREEARWAVAEKEAAESAHAEALKAAQAKHAEALKALEAKHAETVKKLNDELAKLQKQKPAEKKGSPLPAALLGLVLGAGAAAAYFMVVSPPATPTTATVATNTAGTNTVAANTNANTNANANPNGSANNVVAANTNNGSGTGSPNNNGTADTAPKNNDNAMLTGVAGAKDAGTAEIAAVPEKVKDAGAAEVAAVPEKVKDAGTTNTVEAVAMTDKVKDAGTTLLASAEVHSDTAATNKVEEKKPVVEQKQPEKETGDELEALAPDEKTEKKPAEKKGPVPLQANAGTLSLNADLPATVYVNGKKVGNAPIAAYKVNPGKVAVRFDCVVEDVRVKGKTKNVNLAPNGTAKVDYSCVE